MRPPAWRLMSGAVLVGVLGDMLLRGDEWRLGLALWIVALVTTVVVHGEEIGTERMTLLMGMTLASFGVVWRDSELLLTLDVLSVLCMGALIIWHGSGKRVRDLTVVESIRVGVLALVNTAIGAGGVIGGVNAERSGGESGGLNVRALALGGVLAVPPLLIVGALLASSDATFSGLLNRFVSTIVADGFRHAIVVIGLTWIAAGWMRAAVGDAVGASIPGVPTPGLPFVSVAVGLYGLLALLVVFFATQATVLFGGAEFLRTTAGLSAANYAREGFFQLIAAAGIVLGTLVLAEWSLKSDDATASKHYRLVGGALIALVATLLGSAAVRIWLYVNEFGLTIDRVFASAAVVWVLCVLVACALTTLRGRAREFMPATLWVTIAWVATFNLVNPEALIVRVNVLRSERGQTLDVLHLAGLSADALPTFRKTAHRMRAADCTALEAALQESWSKYELHADVEKLDWRNRSVPRLMAERWYRGGGKLCPTSASTPVAARE
jgi:Domain of unknown function (DUF4173)